MKKPWVRLSFVFILTLGFLYFFFRSVGWKEVLNCLTDVNIIIFIFVILLAPLHFLTRAIRWQYLLKHEKRGVTLFNRFAANVIGFTVTFAFPGRLGEIAKPLYLAKKENMKKGFVLGTQVVERIFDILAMCFLLAVFLFFKSYYAPYFNPDKETYSILTFTGIGAVAFAAFILILIFSIYFFRDKTLSVIARILKPLPQKVSSKIHVLIEEFIEGLKFFHSIGNILMYMLLSVIVWLGITFFFWMFFFAYHVSVPFFSLIPYMFLTMVGASIPTPGMVGGFHYFSKLGLTSFFNVDPNLAVGMTIVMHGLQLVVTCIIGYAILWKEGISMFQIKKLREESEQ